MSSGRIAFVETSLGGSGLLAMRQARDLGAQVLFLTRGRDYYDARGEVFPVPPDPVDELVGCDTLDPVAVARALVGRAVDAVVSPGEYFVAVAAEAARLVGARGLAPEAAAAVRDKEVTTRRCAAAGLPVPRSVPVGPDDDLERARSVGFPCVVKPVDGAASAGVAFCESEGDLRAAVQAVRAAAVTARGQLRPRRALVTEYVPGAEVSVETLSHDGVTDVLACTDKHVAGLPHFVEIGHTVPAALSAATRSACAQLAVAALAAVSYDLGVAHVEIKLGPDGPVLLEVNGRPAGDRIPELVRLAYGTDLLRDWVRVHLGLGPQPQPVAQPRAASIRFLTAAPGTVARATGVELARRVPGVVAAALEVAAGDTVGPLQDSHGRVGWVVATGPDAAAAERAAEVGCGQLCVRIAAPPRADLG